MASSKFEEVTWTLWHVFKQWKQMCILLPLPPFGKFISFAMFVRKQNKTKKNNNFSNSHFSKVMYMLDGNKIKWQCIRLLKCICVFCGNSIYIFCINFKIKLISWFSIVFDYNLTNPLLILSTLFSTQLSIKCLVNRYDYFPDVGMSVGDGRSQ